MGTAEKLVAVTDDVARAGAIIWWRLSGTVDVERFDEEWLDAGLDTVADAPAAPSANVALKRTLQHVLGRRKDVLLRGNDVFRLVPSGQETEELNYARVIRTMVQDGGASFSPVKGWEDDAATLTATFVKEKVTLSTTDFSIWLSHVMPKFDAVSLRDTGGIYFVPETRLRNFKQVATLIEQLTKHVIQRVPALRSDDAVRAILDALEQEALKETEKMQEELSAEKLQARALNTRLKRCDGLEQKLTRYETLLGGSLESLRERLEAIRAQLTVAALSATEEDAA